MARVVIGFSGTQVGMTTSQRYVVAARLGELAGRGIMVEAHHGDCVGSDEQFHKLCLSYAIPVVVHPPTNESKRAFCEGARRIERPKPYLKRNRDIVLACAELLATPKEAEEPTATRAGGTWWTIRYARKRLVSRHVVLPDGSITE